MATVQHPKVTRHAIRWWFAVLLGFGIPVLAISMEWRTHCLSGCAYDPMPTPWHLGLLLIVPMANVLALIVGVRGLTWAKSFVTSIRWSAVGVALLHVIALGPVIQVFALIFAPFSLCSWMMDSFAWPEHGNARLMAETNACILLVISPILTLVGWWCARPWYLACECHLHSHSKRSIRLVGGVAVFALVTYAESTQIAQWLGLQSYVGGKTHGEVPTILLSAVGTATVSRLAHAPQQFSSDGLLDCEGPVDVFGPTVRILNRWASPTEMWMRFTSPNRHAFLELIEKAKHETAQPNLMPQSWRGLSSWEKWELEQRP